MLSFDLHPMLTAEKLEVLKNHKIRTPLDFVQANNEKMAALVSCAVVDIILIKERILSFNGSKALRAVKLYDHSLRNTVVVGTGIKEVDCLLGGGLSSGTVTEIFGHSICGKTQMVLHLSAQASLKCSLPVVYFSSSELSAARVLNIMSGLESENDHLEALRKISFSHVSGVYELLDLLWHQSIQTFRVVIIDSLASIFAPILADCHNDAISLLNKVASDLKRLAVDNQCVVVVINHEASKNRPSLGRYWWHVPHLRLHSQRLSAGRFQLTVVGSVYGPPGPQRCCFELSPAT